MRESRRPNCLRSAFSAAVFGNRSRWGVLCPFSKRTSAFASAARHDDICVNSRISCRIKRVKVCKAAQFLDPYFKLEASY